MQPASPSPMKSRNRAATRVDPLLGARGSDRLRSRQPSQSYDEDDPMEEDDQEYSRRSSSRLSKRNRYGCEDDMEEEEYDYHSQRPAPQQDRAERLARRTASASHHYSAAKSPKPKKGLLTNGRGVRRRGTRATSEDDQEEEDDDDVVEIDDGDVDEAEINGETIGSGGDEHNDEEEEEESENGREVDGKHYSFRNREKTKRETLNVQTLGGDGGGYRRRSHVMSRELRPSDGTTTARDHVDYTDGGRNYGNHQPRLFLGGKIPNFNLKPKTRRRPHHSSSSGFARRHYDSSSDSSSDGASGREGRSALRRRGNASHGPDAAISEDLQFHSYERSRQQLEQDSIQPLNIAALNGAAGPAGGMRDRASHRDLLRADVTPLHVDKALGFDSIGGLESHIQALKEMVMLPLLYPDVFQRFSTDPPRGVLFLGPPGTGKTLTARALANSISAGAQVGGRKISFFMRKGADCLSKWVGEGERQLRLLFDQAKKYQPSIIFFDEIDGLAPVRSVKQDQIHASIVSTLLALMDGLDSRGQIVVIGATNRPDAIDPALRRPGRFDRELLFPLPNAKARSAILKIHTTKWDPALDEATHDWIVRNTVGYCGADIKAFCAEAALMAFRRSFPQIYDSNYRLALDSSKLVLRKGDFAGALKKVIPCSQRSGNLFARPLEESIKPLLENSLHDILAKLQQSFPASVALRGTGHSSKSPMSARTLIDEDSGDWIASLTDAYDDILAARTLLESSVAPSSLVAQNGHATTDVMTKDNWLWSNANLTYMPRCMISGAPDMGQELLAAAVLHHHESLPQFSLDLSSLLSDMLYHSPEQALVCRVQEAYRVAPAVVYVGHLLHWWRSASDSLRVALFSVKDSFAKNAPVLWVTTLMATAEESRQLQERNPHQEDSVYNDHRVVELIKWLCGDTDYSPQHSSSNAVLTAPSDSARYNFFNSYFSELHLLPLKIYTAKMSIYKSRLQSFGVDAGSPPKDEQQLQQAAISRRSQSKAPSEGSNTKTELTDEDKQYIRDIRTFFRAALAELMKEKRCHVFNRPVDPEAVPDYYDVIKCPMDLETMRMKVDEQSYPTLAHFLRDIEQIVFNAKEYNPLTRTDQRGKSIVHAAHGMIDIVESHAYHFKEELGYDLFRKCDMIAMREGCASPLPAPSSQDSMHSGDKKFYAAILQEHERLKAENSVIVDQNEDKDVNGCSNISFAKTPRDETTRDCDVSAGAPEKRVSLKNGKKTSVSGTAHVPASPPVPARSLRSRVSNESSSSSHNDFELFAIADAALQSSRKAGGSKKSKRSSGSSYSSPLSLNGFDGEGTGHVHFLSNFQEDSVPNASAQNGLKSEINSPNHVNQPAMEPIIKLTEEDVNSLPIMMSLMKSIEIAAHDESIARIRALSERVMHYSQGYSVNQLVALITQINLVWRQFQAHGEWTRSYAEMECIVCQLQ